MKLIYTDLTDPRTLTYKTADHHSQTVKELERKLERARAFDTALYNYLQTHGEMSLELYNCAVAWFEHSDKSVAEIFNEIIEIGG